MRVSTRFTGEAQQINLIQAAFVNKLGKKRIAKNQEAELVISFGDEEAIGIVGIKLMHKERGALMDVQLTTEAKPVKIGAINNSNPSADLEASSYFKYLGDIVTIKLAGKQGSLDDKAIFSILSATGKK